MSTSHLNGPSITFEPNSRLPDPRIRVLDESFVSLRLLSGTVEQVATGFYWAEGPQWFGDGRFLLFSDIPNNRIMRWDQNNGTTSVFRSPSNFSNGLARDRQGRLLTCEHGARRVTRTEYDGSITVLADQYKGKRLNSPNDIVCKRDSSIWFTDPPFGISGWWEGTPATPELPHGVYCLNTNNGELNMLLEDVAGSNGLAFSPDEKILYVVESRATPYRRILQYDVAGSLESGYQLVNKREFVNANGNGAYDGIAIDNLGNVWCGFGSSGAAGADLDDLDGVRVYSPDGKALAHIALPERCANVCFGGPMNNRLFMTASHSLYALHVNVRGAIS
jgi:gluconolactonase